MGNMGSSGRGHSRRRHRNHNNHPPPPPPQTPQPEITGNRYVSPAAIPFPDASQTQHNQNLGNYPTPPPPMMSAVHTADSGHANWVGGRHPCAPPLPLPAPYVEHQKAVTIRNDVNIKRETMRVEPDEENPGQFLVAFTFDATVSGSITVIFFAKEDADCNLIPTKENLLEPITVSFQQGLGQKFRQPSGTGIDFLMFEETKLLEGGNEEEVYPLAVKAEAYALDHNGSEAEKPMPGTVNSQITEAVFEKERGEYQVKVVKQILWVNGVSYELQEIYGIRNSVDCDLDGNDTGKECVICLSEPQDTTVLPCRHMCLCSGCAKLLQFQTNRCPICRQPVERLLEIKVNNRPDDE